MKTLERGQDNKLNSFSLFLKPIVSSINQILYQLLIFQIFLRLTVLPCAKGGNIRGTHIIQLTDIILLLWR